VQVIQTPGSDGAGATGQVHDEVSRKMRSHSSATAHTRMVSSELPETRRRPSGEKATALIVPVWPGKAYADLPLVRSQTRTIASPPPEAARVPSGDSVTA